MWLLAFGGTFLLAFPGVMAASFAGFYLALWLVLWSFILRGVSIEVGGHIHDRLWQSWWDFVFAVSSLLLAVLFGAALGNVIRGVPLDGSGKFTHVALHRLRRAGPGGDPRLVHAVRRGVHDGAARGARRDLPPAQDHRSGARAKRAPRALAVEARPCCFPSSRCETWIVRPALYGAMVERPVAWLAMAVVVAGAWALFTGLRGTGERRAFVGSCAVIAGLLAGAAAAVFPVMLHSTLAPEHSMTAYNGAAPAHGLAMALIWWPVAFVLALTYFTVVMRNYRGKVRPAEDTQGFY